MKKLFVFIIAAAFTSVFLCGSVLAFDVRSGPILNNHDAKTKCPNTCHWYGGWKGNWKTTIPGQMSVCGCNTGIQSDDPGDKNAGPIWSNADAPKKCADACHWYGGWNGNWKTTRVGQMSVCGCNQKD